MSGHRIQWADDWISGRFDHKSRFDTIRAYGHTLGLAVLKGPNAL